MSFNRPRHEKQALKRGLRKNFSEQYPLERSPFWRLQSLHLLARHLDTTPDGLQALANDPLYRPFEDSRRSRKTRVGDIPLGHTQRAHYRILKLLDRIQRPSFLHSATQERSYISNAQAHANSPGHIVATDIKKFFQSTTQAHVARFFQDDLGWANDLAALMARICTVNGHLPLGSCISPLMSYLVHRQMFADIQAMCESRAAVFTLYVDDLTISGEGATRGLLRESKQRIWREGLRTHGDRLYPRSHTATVTGVIIKHGQLLLPNRQHKAVCEAIHSIRQPRRRDNLKLASMLGMVNAIDPCAAGALKLMLKRKLERLSPATLKPHPAQPKKAVA